jgi:hypothetical protein
MAPCVAWLKGFRRYCKPERRRYKSKSASPLLRKTRAITILAVRPDTWRIDPVHPFVVKFERDRGRIRGEEVEGVIDPSAIFDRGLEFLPFRRVEHRVEVLHALLERGQAGNRVR